MGEGACRIKPWAIGAFRVEEETGCWSWILAIDRHGYGATTDNSKSLKAHRRMYTDFCGDIPTGIFVLHNCDNPRCVNPNHLRIGTARDNAADCVQRGRTARGDKHGFRIHPDAPCRGERSPRAKNSDHEVREAIAMYHATKNSPEVGRVFGVNPHTVMLWVQGKSRATATADTTLMPRTFYQQQ